MQADVIVIGAGAAGLMAAATIAAKGKTVLVLEARTYAGGRACTLHDNLFQQPVELGAEFIHGNLPLTLALLKKAGIPYTEAEGDFLRYKNGLYVAQEDGFEHYDLLIKELKKLKEDTDIESFLATRFEGTKYEDFKKSVQDYVEGYYAAEMRRASAFALRHELLHADEEQYRITGGYTQLMQYLQQQCTSLGCTFVFGATVKTIAWEKQKVTVHTTAAQTCTAQKVVVTLPLGVLQNTHTAVRFAPEIMIKQQAINNLGFGPVIKILLGFNAPFWKTHEALKNLGFLISEEAIPTWWTQHPAESGLLVGWCAGPKAKSLQHLPDVALFDLSLQAVAKLFKMPMPALQQKVTAWKVCNWAADALTQGGYTYVTVNTYNALKELEAPEEETIYFAGEAFNSKPEIIGTVEGALVSGKKVAEKVLDSAFA